MTREDIEKAAVEFANDKCQKRGCSKTYRFHFDFDRCDIEQSFETGAEWRINSVWHDDISKGETRKVILVQFDNGLFNLFEDIRDLKGIEDKVKAFAYIEDLIPNTEE